MSQPKCPCCFRAIPGTIEMLACVGTCPTESPTAANRLRGWDAFVPRLFRAPGGASSGNCDKCGVRSTQEACPSCRGPIPGLWREPGHVVTCVAMAGARSTGKSLYLGVLTGQLAEWVTTQQRSRLQPVGDTERLHRERYRDPLYEERRLLEPTAKIQDDETAQQPLIYTYRELGGTARVVVLRDVAGEDLQALDERRPGPEERRKLEERQRSLDFLTRADGVIALLDPYKVDEIRNVLAGIADPAGEVGGDGIRVIDRLTELMVGERPGVRTEIPIAVAMSKFDVLHELRRVDRSRLHSVMVRPGSPLRRDPSMGSPDLNIDDLDLVHAEMDSLFDQIGGLELSNLMRERAETFHYFAVSALGRPTQRQAVHAAGIAPFRVLDPLRWILQVTS